LHTDADRAAANVELTRLRDRVVVDIEGAVEVVCDDFGEVVEFLEGVGARLGVDMAWKSEGGEVVQ
jgi:hypothetical protein